MKNTGKSESRYVTKVPAGEEAGKWLINNGLKKHIPSGLNLSDNPYVKISPLLDGIMNNKSVLFFDLSNTGISPANLKEGVGAIIQRNKSIISLNLSRNDIGPEGIALLSEAFKKNNMIQYFNLSDSKIGNDGLTKLLELVNSNMSLTNLNLGNNNIGLEGIIKFLEGLKTGVRLTYLDLTNNNKTEVTTNDAERILKAVGSHKSLMKVNFNDNNISQDILDSIKNILAERGPVGAYDDGLGIQNTQNEFAIKIPASSEGFDLILQGVKENKLIYLDLKDYLGINAIWNLSEVLKKSTNLTSLDLSHCGLTPKEVSNFGGVNYNESLVKLNLSYNKIGSDGMVPLSNFLLKQKSITHFNLSNNFLGARNINEQQDLSRLANLIGMNNTITSLDISGNQIGNGISRLLDALEKNKTITYINLSNNELGNTGVVKICDKKLPNLISVELSDNAIGPEVTNNISSFIANNSLTSLDLSKNKLKVDTQEILNAVKGNTSLKKLNLDGNEVMKEIQEEITKVLAERSPVDEHQDVPPIGNIEENV